MLNVEAIMNNSIQCWTNELYISIFLIWIILTFTRFSFYINSFIWLNIEILSDILTVMVTNIFAYGVYLYNVYEDLISKYNRKTSIRISSVHVEK